MVIVIRRRWRRAPPAGRASRRPVFTTGLIMCTEVRLLSAEVGGGIVLVGASRRPTGTGGHGCGGWSGGGALESALFSHVVGRRGWGPCGGHRHGRRSGIEALELALLSYTERGRSRRPRIG
eukprot:scaffold304379_cov27-Tisochrysis_lutea.AAC.3